MTVHFVDIGGIVDHYCLEVTVHFVDIGGIVDHYCFYFLLMSYKYAEKLNAYDASSIYTRSNFICILVKCLAIDLLTET